jgi:hypothetical protein
VVLLFSVVLFEACYRDDVAICDVLKVHRCQMNQLMPGNTARQVVLENK